MGYNDHFESVPSPENPEMYARWLRRQQLIFNGELSENEDERNFFDFDTNTPETKEPKWTRIK